MIIIGERINPSGRRRLAKRLVQGDMSLARQEALAQVEAGALIIDVNMSAVDVDEERILPLAVGDSGKDCSRCSGSWHSP